MIIRINDENTYDPGFKNEDLWDGQLCLTESAPARLLIWDEKQEETLEIENGFLGRSEATRWLNKEEGFQALSEQIAEILYRREEDWKLSEIEEHPVCEIVAGTIDVGTRFLAKRVFEEISEKCKVLPDSHFASEAI